MKKPDKYADHIIQDGTKKFLCRIYRVNRRRLSIVITPDLNVDIFVPENASEKFIHETLRQKTAWIARSIRRLKNCRVLPEPEHFKSGEKIAFLGKEYILCIERHKRGPAELQENNLIIRSGRTDMKSVKRALDRWCRTQATEILGSILDRQYAVVSKYSLKEPSLSIRSMRSRWGSCGTNGKITLNLRLIHLPVICIEYIAMHELCHLRHANHSKDFYSFLSLCMPDWRERKKILESYRLPC